MVVEPCGSFGVVLLELITGRNPIMPDPTSRNPNVMVTLARWVRRVTFFA